MPCSMDLHDHAALMCMSILHAHVHAECPCFMSMLHNYIYCMFMQQVNAALTCNMNIVQWTWCSEHGAWAWRISTLHVHMCCIYMCMNMLPVLAAWSCISMLHVHACPCMSMHFHAEYPCCMNILIVHAVWTIEHAAQTCCIIMLNEHTL
jgi:hypothetical protein